MSLALPCPYHADARCRSCGWLERGYTEQLATKDASTRALLADAQVAEWLPVVSGACAGFRHKAKLAVGGTVDHPTLGRLDAGFEGIDLSDCPLYPADFAPLFALLKVFIKRTRLTPYRVAKKRGELKYLLLNRSYAHGEFMLRFVLRSTEQLPRLREHLPWLLAEMPALKVVTANIQPVHMAVLEGEQEIFLTEQQALPEHLNDVPLYLRPRGFFQTHPEVAARLYATAREWVGALPAGRLWDMYCGAGGFGLHCAGPGRPLTGIEQSADAIDSARQSAGEMGLENAEFLVGDATAFARDADLAPDLVLVNPPRRGIGRALCERLQLLAPEHILYSSCNPATLLEDVQRLSSYSVAKAQCFDMFPHSEHCEVLALLVRAG